MDDNNEKESDDEPTTTEQLGTPRGVIEHKSTIVNHDSSSLVMKAADLHGP